MTTATVSPCGFSSQPSELGLEVLRNNDLGRAQAEQYIHEVFARVYSADVKHFMPQLMVLRSESNEFLAALGIRFAQTAPLFLEQYLDVPVEQAVARAAQTAVARSSVVELGNLASLQRGGLRCLIIGLTAYLKGAGAKWATFTAVPAVYNAFVKMGIPLFELGPADASRVIGGAADWGTYYDHSPRVVVGNVEAAYEALATVLRPAATVFPSCCLWEGAYRMGRDCAARHGVAPVGALLNAGC